MKYLYLIPATLLLTACGDSQLQVEYGSPAPSAIAEADYGYAKVEREYAPAPAPPPGSEMQPFDPSGIFLAYRYGYGVQLPANAVKPTADKHMQICQDAGLSKCQIMGSSANAYSDDDVRATLSLRAEPEWLESFVANMRSDIETADGELTSATTNVQDLTRSILDTDARLTAQRTLRGRLENLLETRDAKLPDLLALERELARVQSEIESATANLKALRARVSMSTVDINYTSQSVAVSRSAFAPIGAAFKDVAGIVSDSLATVIRFAAGILPWLIFVILPGLWIFRWAWRRRRARKAG